MRQVISLLDRVKLFRFDLSDQLMQRPRQHVVDGRVQESLGFLLERRPAQIFLDAFRQSLVHQFVNFAMDALARDEDLFDERKLLVIVVNFELDQRANLLARVLAGGDVGEMMNNRRHLAVDALLDESDGFRREGFRQRRIAVRQIVESSGNEILDLCVQAPLR